MRLLFYNAIGLGAFGAPMLVVYLLSRRVKWVSDRKEALQVGAWIIGLVLLWGVIAPHYGLSLNPNYLADQ